MKTYSVSEAAAVCKCHPDTIRNLIHDGRLRASKLGRGYCIRAEELDALLAESENARVQASLADRSDKCLDKKTTESTNGTIFGISFVSASGKRISRSAGTKEKREACELRDKLKYEAWRVSRLGEKPKQMRDDAALRWLREKSHKKSIADNMAKIHALKQLRGVYLHHIDRDLIQTTVERLPCQNSTKNRYLALIRSILKAAVNKWEWLDRAPYVEVYKESSGRIRWLRPEEAQRLIDAARPRYFADLIIFSLNTGLRQANVLGLKWNQVDIERRVCWYYADETKSGRALGVAFVFVNKRGNPMKDINSRDWKETLKKAEIENFTWHDLRHTWASWLVQRGIPLRVVQEMGGWQTLAMVQRYSHLAPEHLHEHAQLLHNLVVNREPAVSGLAQIRHKQKKQS